VTLQVELVSPERILFSGGASLVLCRTTEGEIEFLTGHAPFVGALVESAVRIQMEDGATEVAAVHGGIVEVNNDRVILLCDVAELASMIDRQRAERAREEAERRLAAGEDSAAEAALRRANIRLQVATA
jgi:F-type H+-transporting ATPase subunit epsilon